MNKKTTKLLVSLLSVLMVLSFMPTMAFAETGRLAPSAPGHILVYDEDASVEPSCSFIGIEVWNCYGQDLDAKGNPTNTTNKTLIADHLDCNATYVRLVDEDPTAHEYENVYIDGADYLAYVLDKENEAKMASANRTLTEQETQAIVDQYATVCTVYGKECSICGDIVVEPSGVLEHTPEEGTAPCAKTYKCKYCGETIERTYGTTANATHYTDHNVSKSTLIETHTNVCNVYTVEVRKCKDCGEEFKVNTNPSALYAQHTGFGEKMTPTEAEINASKYCHYNYGNATGYYKYNKVVTEPTCTQPGVGTLICEDCLREGLHSVDTNATIPALGHDYVKAHVDADHTHGTIDFEYCKRCGAIKPSSYVVKNDKVAHSYTMTVVKEADCYGDALVLITCPCGKFVTNREGEITPSYPWNTTSKATVVNTKPTDNSGDWYFVGFDREFYKENPAGDASRIDTSKAIKVASWNKIKEDLGAYETLRPATCTIPELQAQKCKKCGDFNVHTVRPLGKALGHDKVTEVTEPTCGDCGHKVVSCKRCKEILDYEDFGEPVKYYGAECTYEWKVTKVPTATEDGEKALVCSVCGAVKPASETVVPKDSDEAKDAVIAAEADPAIEAASTIIADKAKYTADSVKAIEEAKAMLNQAIASGNAADVSRAAAKLQAAVNAAAKKQANPMVAKGKTVKAKSGKKTTIKKAKAFTVKKAQGKVTFKKASGNKKITVSKVGKVTVKKGLKKGKTYKVKVKVTAAGNGNYLAKTKTVTLKVKVTK